MIFNILKPDMVRNKRIIDYYFEELKQRFNVDIKDIYYINDWIKISKLLYELDVQDNNLTLDEIKQKRKQLLTTIKGYDIYYNKMKAVVCLYHIENNNIPNALQELLILKKKIRQNFVNQTDKFYLKFLNEKDIDFSIPLHKYNLEEILVESCVIPYYKEMNDPKYNMIFFNKIHSPDVSFENVEKEIQILYDNNILVEKNRIDGFIK